MDAEKEFIDAWNAGKVRRVSDGAKPWVGLTDEERDRFVYIDEKDKKRFRKYAKYVEQTLKEKNDNTTN